MIGSRDEYSMERSGDAWLKFEQVCYHQPSHMPSVRDGSDFRALHNFWFTPGRWTKRITYELRLHATMHSGPCDRPTWSHALCIQTGWSGQFDEGSWVGSPASKRPNKGGCLVSRKYYATHKASIIIFFEVIFLFLNNFFVLLEQLKNCFKTNKI